MSGHGRTIELTKKHMRSAANEPDFNIIMVKQYQGTETAKIDREKNELAIRIWLKRREAD